MVKALDSHIGDHGLSPGLSELFSNFLSLFLFLSGQNLK